MFNYKRYIFSVIIISIFLIGSNFIKKILNNNDEKKNKDKKNKEINKKFTLILSSEENIKNALDKPSWIWKNITKYHPIELILPLRQPNVIYNKKEDKFYLNDDKMEWIPSDYNNKGYWCVIDEKNNSSYQINYRKLPDIVLKYKY